MKIIEFLSPGFHENPSLNPLLWQDNHLINKVRHKLLEIAEHFRAFVDVEFPVVDIVITGGQTTKFYTDHSDLDLHIITDYQEIDCDQELEELFDTKRLLYKKEFDIQVLGIPVELYVEDLNQPAVGGAYSLIKNQWIRPSTQPKSQIDKTAIARQSARLFRLINKILPSNDVEILNQLKHAIWQYRKQGLGQHGEYGLENLVFKTLRNSGILDELKQKIRDLENQQLGLSQ